ncbi:MAG: protein translocase subunit SecF [Homoserinimonas sp.]
MANLTQFGNDLYTGKKSFNFVGKYRLWYTIALVLMAASLVVPLVNGFNFGIEFRGGSQFQITEVEDTAQQPAIDAVQSVVPDQVAHVTTVGASGLRVQTEQLSDDETSEVAQALGEAFDVPAADVTASFIGPSWGADITAQAIRALIVFVALAVVMMAIYFRTWKMAIAALLALVNDLVITAGVYAATGFEVTPGAIIGFLTILGFSLYDTVVVFDKVRENTSELGPESRQTFGEAVNLAVNQTLVRSINTGVVAALPVAAILFIGSFVLGADTLRDISLALLVGIIVGTLSTIFIGAPIYAHLRGTEPEIKKQTARVQALRVASAE